MKTNRLPPFTLALAVSVGTALGQHQTTALDEPHVGGTIPYTVDIQEISLAPAAQPSLHSVAAAEWNGEWVLLAGRTNGLHGMTGMNAFDPLYENREVWVINPATHQSWHKSLETSAASGLSQDQVDSLSCVNSQFHQDGETLVIVGGYGYKRSVADHRTYDTLSAIDLPGLVGWVKQAAGTETSLASDHIKQTADAYFQVTGGSLEKIGDEYQLVFGQNYNGRYRPNFNGVYTRQVRRFTMTLDASGQPVIPAGSKVPTGPADAYRRRDLNVVPIVERVGPGLFEEKVVALSGVFTPDNGVWTVPVLIEAGGVVSMDDPLAPASLQQAFQIYHCAKASLFDRVTGESHILLFGGITVLERDLATGTFIRDDQAPFTNQCSLVVRRADGSFTQHWLPTRFPLITSNDLEIRFGANAEFFPAENLKQIARKVLDLSELDEPTVIGHIHGGLVADAGNGGNTGSSGRVFQVTLVPTAASAPPLRISEDATELSWDVGVGGDVFLLEDSGTLESWDELATGLTSSPFTLGSPLARRHFFRLRSSTPVSP
ncbi:hypothetical protein [Haloferula rosea]|uniref:Uncharacterized protein n=1 Tax=Haloferula rosea TaxID=490093 RepID=A0A934VCQ3_9BACT|nr:hypothetical protein [Haloferula rosea]MBK1828693.1 hypothetical protein [Haloferula rosea]